MTLTCYDAGTGRVPVPATPDAAPGDGSRYTCSVMWILRSTEPDLSFRLLPGEIRTIGRATGAQFVVDAPLVSRVHCRLASSAEGVLTVEDLGSTNGTYVNDCRVEQPTPLQAADTLRVGRVAFEVSRS